MEWSTASSESLAEAQKAFSTILESSQTIARETQTMTISCNELIYHINRYALENDALRRNSQQLGQFKTEMMRYKEISRRFESIINAIQLFLAPEQQYQISCSVFNAKHLSDEQIKELEVKDPSATPFAATFSLPDSTRSISKENNMVMLDQQQLEQQQYKQVQEDHNEQIENEKNGNEALLQLLHQMININQKLNQAQHRTPESAIPLTRKEDSIQNEPISQPDVKQKSISRKSKQANTTAKHQTSKQKSSSSSQIASQSQKTMLDYYSTTPTK